MSKARLLRVLGAAGLLLTSAFAEGLAAGEAAVPAPAKSTPVPTAGVATERRLHLAAVEASSFLWDDFSRFQQNYHPLYLGDDDPKTAWVEGVKGHGEGEWVRLRITPMEGATRVRLLVRNGYQKTERLFGLNSRLKEITVTLLPSGKAQKAELRDTQGFQEVVLTQPSGPLNAVELKVGSAYPGSKWDDLTVSDVQLYVTATSPENPAFEKSRLDKLLKWKADRAAAAAQFKSNVKTHMPVLAQYKAESQNHEPTKQPRRRCPSGDPSSLCDLRGSLALGAKDQDAPADEVKLGSQLLQTSLADFAPVRVVPVDARPFPTTDGLCLPILNSCENDGCSDGIEMPMPNQLGYLSAGGFNAFAEPTTPPILQALHGRGKECQHGDPGRTYYYAYKPRSTEGRESLRALLIVRCGRVESREGSVSAVRPQLLVYNPQGQLAVVTGPDSLSWLRFKERSGAPVLVGGTHLSPWFHTQLSEPETVAAK